MLAGNLYSSEAETPRNDASYGLFLQGAANNKFEPKPFTKSGLYVKGDVKNISLIKLAGGKTGLVFAINGEPIKVFAIGD